MFHPFELSGSNCVLGRTPPKLRSEIVPQQRAGELDACPLERVEAREAEGHRVGARAQIHDSILPDPSLMAERTFSISAGLVASTVTPGSTAPDASLMTPVIVACAKARAGASHTMADAAAHMTTRRTQRASFGSRRDSPRMKVRKGTRAGPSVVACRKESVSRAATYAQPIEPVNS
jgi:hypothetical protein